MEIYFTHSNYRKGVSIPLFEQRGFWMKISITFLLFSVLGLQLLMANGGYGQSLEDEIVTLEVKGKFLPEVLKEIEKQTDYRFAYTTDHIAGYRVDLDLGKRNLEETLNLILAGKPLQFKVVKDKFIVLSVMKKRIHSSVVKPLKSFNLDNQVLKILPLNVSGTVTDDTGEPLIGVNIQVKGTNKGTATDFEGNFTLNDIDEDAVLVVSYIGYQTQEISVAGKSGVNVTLLSDAQLLDEVVVVGYGTIKKSELTSAIAKVEGEQLQSRPVARVDQALQGQLAGVHVSQSGGKPGKNAIIRVRGVGLITAGNDPLFVIDGFPVDAETFANLNMATVESIEVLKDAASASIYGSRGSNGVIIVTTERGTEGQKMKVNLNAYKGIAKIERQIPLLNGSEFILQYGDTREDSYQQAGGDPSIPPMERAYSYRYYKEMYDNAENAPDYNYQDAFGQTGTRENYQLSATGAAEKARYMFSLGYFNETGIILNTFYKRFNFAVSADFDVTKFLTVGVMIRPNFSIIEDRNTENKGGIVMEALGSPPIIPPRQGYSGESEIFSDFQLYDNFGKSALPTLEQLKDREETGRVLSNAYAEISFFPELKFKTSFNARYSNGRRDIFQNSIIQRNKDIEGTSNSSQTLNWLNENILSYNKIFERHSIRALAGFTSQKNDYDRQIRLLKLILCFSQATSMG